MVVVQSRRPILVVTRSLARAVALAGLRCGFTRASREESAMLARGSVPYPIPEHITQ
ncbi:histidinol-phosphate transaminase, partial [Aeromonas jandaei]